MSDGRQPYLFSFATFLIAKNLLRKTTITLEKRSIEDLAVALWALAFVRGEPRV